jgi:nicotinate dehydrogenase subunit B
MTGWSRREFLARSGALIVSFSVPAWLGPSSAAQGPFATHPSHIDPSRLDSWIAVGADGMVTAFTGKCDFGQGMYTAQTQLVAEELGVRVTSVHLIQCDTAVTPDQGVTSGSQSTPTNFNDGGLAQAAATAREALVSLAGQHLGLPVNRLKVRDGMVTADNGSHVSYGELVAGKKFNLPIDVKARRRAPSEWTLLGKPLPPLEMKSLVLGQYEFVHNVHVEGMLHGRVVRPPAVGAKVVSIDESSVRGMSGVVKVVVRQNFVGLVAQKQKQAVDALAKLKVVWSAGTKLPSQASFYDFIRQQPSRDVMLVDSGDVEQRLSQAHSVLRATYSHPYQMHGSIGASCAVADVRSGNATIWSATQSVYPTRKAVAELLGLSIDNVRVVFVRGSGCYGLNGADTVSFDAALLSHAVEKPVRVQLSREDEMAWGESYGAACVIDQRAALDADGSIAVWDCETWATSLGGRPGYDRTGNVITGFLAGFAPQSVVAKPASAPSAELENGSNQVPSYVSGCVGPKCNGAGKVRSERVLSRTVASPFFTGPLRSPLRLQNTFAHECFMDELSARAKADPVSFRLQHLSEPRMIEVVKGVAHAAQWEPRPSPGPERNANKIASGRGIACVAYEGENGYVAMTAEVEVDRDSGEVHTKRVVVVQDCGPVSNPDGMRNQIEGGVLQGMSRALGEEVTWNDETITSTDWSTYHSLSLGMRVPTIECVLINRTDVPATGAGETAITVIAAAIGNAIFDATGARLRRIPFTSSRVKAAIAANSEIRANP